MPGKGDRHHPTPQASPCAPHRAPRARCTCSSCARRARRRPPCPVRCPALSALSPSPRLDGASRAQRQVRPAATSRPHRHPPAVWVAAPVHFEGTQVGPHPPTPFSRGSCLWWKLSWTGWGGGPRGVHAAVAVPGDAEALQDLEGEPSAAQPVSGPSPRAVPRAAAAAGAWPLGAASCCARPSLSPPWGRGPAALLRPSRVPGTSPRPLAALLGRALLPDPAAQADCAPAQGTPGGPWRRGASARSGRPPGPPGPQRILVSGCGSCPASAGCSFAQAAAPVLPETCRRPSPGIPRRSSSWGCGRLALSHLFTPPPEGPPSSGTLACVRLHLQEHLLTLRVPRPDPQRSLVSDLLFPSPASCICEPVLCSVNGASAIARPPRYRKSPCLTPAASSRAEPTPAAPNLRGPLPRTL